MMIALQELLEQTKELPAHQKVVAIVVAAAMLLVVLELVRKRKLREEYSILWIATGIVLMALALAPELLLLFMSAIGAKTAPSALFFGALVFLMLVSLLVSIRLSRLTFRSKALNQQIALQRREIEELGMEVERLRREVSQVESGEVPDAAEYHPAPRKKRIAKDGAA